MNIKHKILSLLLVAVMLASAMPFSVLATQGDANPLAFGKPDSNHVVTVSPSELLALLTGETVADVEADYLDRYCDRILEYYDRIPAEKVRLYFHASVLEISADPFSYVAENGVTVTWIPCEAVYPNRTAVALTKHNEVYEARIEGITKDEANPENNRVWIVYRCELSIPETVADALGSFAFDEATYVRDHDLPTTAEYATAQAAYEAYLREMAEYADAQARYEQYLLDCEEYRIEKARYDAYLVKKAEYDRQYAAYEQYGRDLAAYQTAKTEYERIYRENSAAYEAYVAYLSNLNRIRASTYAMESLFVKPSSGKTNTLFRALQNAELVEMFERYRDELVRIYGVSNDTLTHLRTTSDDLNAMLNAYADARERSEEEAFLYYKAHYHEISYLFNYLYDSMREVLTGTIFNHVCAKLELEYTGEMLTYKKWRIKNVLAHIYLTCQALDDTDTGDGTFQFYADNGRKHTYYFSDLLDQNLILTDNNSACPDALSWMPAVEPVTLPEPPVEPTAVSRPVLPQTVAEPPVPTIVTAPTAPATVAAPPAVTDETLARADRATEIVAALEAGTLTRTSFSGAQTVELSKTLVRPFGDGTMVTFYDVSGDIVEAYDRAVGEAVTPPSESPTYDDAQYTYLFAGWATSPDADPNGDLTLPVMPDGDLALYAIYHKTVKRYTVTVKLDENDPNPTVATYDYGAMPVLSERPEKATTADTVYTFAGWSPKPSAVTGHAVYVAQWVETDRLYTVTWTTPSGTVERRERYDAAPMPPTVPTVYYEGCVRYDFAGWSPEPSAVRSDAAYEAQYRRTVLAESENETLTLVPSLGEYHLTGSGARAHIKDLISMAKTENKRVTLSFPSISASLDVEAVQALKREGVTHVARLTDTSGGIGIGFYTANGRAANVSDGVMRLSLDYEPRSGGVPYAVAYDASGSVYYTPSTVEDNALVVAAVAHRTYRVDHQYALNVKGEGGTLFANASLYLAGEKPSITTYPAPQHEISAITLTNDITGESTVLSSLLGFVMPDYPVTLSVIFAPKTYMVTFISRGAVVSEVRYHLGDTVNVPEIVTDFEENGYRYTFIGWSAPIDTVTGDAVYTAKFFTVSTAEVPANQSGEAWAMGTVLWQIGLPVAIGAVALAVGVVFLVRRCVKKKKMKKTK